MKQPRKVPEPTSFTVTSPNQVWSWDISYCPSAVRGQHWYLYLIMDIYSRRIIAWYIHGRVPAGWPRSSLNALYCQRAVGTIRRCCTLTMEHR
ncbi:transposase family protein [Alloalcanivorax gelatiniphagus]|uniref:Transposase family protein n=1 Tax=Alloalcanivorax gelatiniphagus TaxID=1194167 RepID=A0ABY2XN16_9GAMM|nr:transposase family protein [Alloalcanivorax gelatiniphagus]